MYPYCREILVPFGLVHRAGIDTRGCDCRWEQVQAWQPTENPVAAAVVVVEDGAVVVEDGAVDWRTRFD